MQDDAPAGEPTDPVAALRERDVRYLRGFRQREFAGWVPEQRSWKETCYIGDWSFLEDFRVRGPEALDVFADLSVNSFESFPVGRGKHIVQCDENGAIVAEGVLQRLEEDEYATYSFTGPWTEYNLERGAYDATGESVDSFNFQVQGPNAIAVLESVTDDDLRGIAFIDSGEIEVAGRSVTALRMGMAGEPGFELQGPAAYGEDVWDAIVAAGRPHGIERLGARTASINHLEACFPTVGRDYVPAIYGEGMAEFRAWLRDNGYGYRTTYTIDGSFEGEAIDAWYRTPYDLGWGANVAFDHDFRGRTALEAIAEDPPREIVTLEWDPADVADVYASLFEPDPYEPMDLPTDQQWSMRTDRVIHGGEEVGAATSRGYSFHFREMLSLCTIAPGLAEPETEVTVVWGSPEWPEKEIGATVAPAPYKEDRRRADLGG